MFPAYGVAMQMQSLADIRAHYMLDDVVWNSFVECAGTRGKTSDSSRCCLQRFFQRWNVQYYPMVPV